MNAGKPNKKKPNFLFFSFSPARRLHLAFTRTSASPARRHRPFAGSPVRSSLRRRRPKMHKVGKKFVKPGCLSQKLTGYERQRQKRIEMNSMRLEALGIPGMSKALFGSNQNGNEGPNKISNGDDDDEYLPSDNEELNSSGDAELVPVMAAQPTLLPTFSTQQTHELSSPPIIANSVGLSYGLKYLTILACSSSKRVRGKTVGKGIDKLIAQNGGEKLSVPVLDEWNALCGINAPKVTSLLGVYIRRMCPIKGIPTWRHVDEATQSAIIQSVLDKFKISDDYHGNLVAQQAVHRKCYNIHRNWRHNMKLHYKHVKNVLHVDPYSHPYEHVTQEDWRHLIDDVWKSKEHKVRSKAGKKNRKKLEYNHCSGSRSFVATMTIQPEFNGSENLEFLEFYKKTHTKKNKEWIDPICAVKHSKMLSLREESFQSGVQLTSEEMSRQALGKRKRYILGFGDGPKPSSSSSTPSRVSQDHVGEL
ncbi:uncharacterized protein LOC113461311 isoform X1 [Phoenix dactylifera]|uniref:Uncharacterized protein LOC113461311 isoform X1 n=1 Tax=Phoenix dactylifera TaxID=42345 RepID=A0A8B8ZYA1_PHODC|nr:uncharacterized protein LOC113461311 isoform X1 [Phoenix dactylifera]